MRPEIRHYQLVNGALQRVDPVAIGPQDFAAFWLRSDPKDINSRTEQPNRLKMEAWRKEHKEGFLEISTPSKKCEKHPDLWQVETTYGKDFDQTVYFVVRWRPPFHFSMVSVGAFPLADCVDDDLDADGLVSLFQPQ